MENPLKVANNQESDRGPSLQVLRISRQEFEEIESKAMPIRLEEEDVVFTDGGKAVEIEALHVCLGVYVRNNQSGRLGGGHFLPQSPGESSDKWREFWDKVPSEVGLADEVEIYLFGQDTSKGNEEIMRQDQQAVTDQLKAPSLSSAKVFDHRVSPGSPYYELHDVIYIPSEAKVFESLGY